MEIRPIFRKLLVGHGYHPEVREGLRRDIQKSAAWLAKKKGVTPEEVMEAWEAVVIEWEAGQLKAEWEK